eukprot:GHVQ01027910.1.p1 GENE.GHVQ01027910.1~~GHVQ01027910.1.p1  ORF type:complete len:181 (+),score=26.14 GHVQ01027910.1:263-805(+)
MCVCVYFTVRTQMVYCVFCYLLHVQIEISFTLLLCCTHKHEQTVHDEKPKHIKTTLLQLRYHHQQQTEETTDTKKNKKRKNINRRLKEAKRQKTNSQKKNQKKSKSRKKTNLLQTPTNKHRQKLDSPLPSINLGVCLVAVLFGCWSFFFYLYHLHTTTIDLHIYDMFTTGATIPTRRIHH